MLAVDHSRGDLGVGPVTGVMLLGVEPPVTREELPLTDLQIRASCSAKHGRILSEDHSPLAPGILPGGDEGGTGEDERRETTGGADDRHDFSHCFRTIEVTPCNRGLLSSVPDLP